MLKEAEKNQKYQQILSEENRNLKQQLMESNENLYKLKEKWSEKEHSL